MRRTRIHQHRHAASPRSNRRADLARAFDASTSRSRGGAFVTSAFSSPRAAWVTSSIARLNAASLARDGRVKPLSFRTNCSEDARISSSVAGGVKLCRVLIFRHIVFVENLQKYSKTMIARAFTVGQRDHRALPFRLV